MKRISIIIALLVLAPAVSQGRHSQRYQTRYHPYAFGYHNSGLISGGLRYSPYAFTPHSSGLTFAGARYEAYALSYHNSGLIVDCYWSQAPVCPSYKTYNPCSVSRNQYAVRSRTTRRNAAPRHSISPARLRDIRESDGMHIIRQYLEGRELGNVEISHRLSVENRTAGVVFILREKGLVIRYSNPEVIESFVAKSESARKAFERHEERWEALARTFQESGGAVYCVNTAEKDQIVAALDSCDRLAPDATTMHPTMLYAKD